MTGSEQQEEEVVWHQSGNVPLLLPFQAAAAASLNLDNFFGDGIFFVVNENFVLLLLPSLPNAVGCFAAAC